MNQKNSSNDFPVLNSVVEGQIQGLKALKEVFDQKIVSAIDLIEKNKGNLIVSGMGKSGIIAKKIAATFASTGTTAYFVHPGEASHGDLGMIRKEDIVLLLSNSGETMELKPMINYCKNLGIKIIGMVRNAGSTLASNADIALIIPAIPEVNEFSAPTTSTTMMLVLGDALAMAVAKRKAFCHNGYRDLHPGGALGAKFCRVSDVMHVGNAIPLCEPREIMSDVLLTITSKGFGIAIVHEDMELRGVITDGDLRRYMNVNLLKMQAKDIMSKNPKSISKNLLVSDALDIMNNRSITSLVVEEDGQICGIVHIHDCLRVGV